MQKNKLFLFMLLVGAMPCVTRCSDEHEKSMNEEAAHAKERTAHNQQSNQKDTPQKNKQPIFTSNEKNTFKSYARWSALLTEPITYGLLLLGGKVGETVSHDNNKLAGFALGSIAGILFAKTLVNPRIDIQVRRKAQADLRPGHDWNRDERDYSKKVYAGEKRRIERITGGLWIGYHLSKLSYATYFKK